MNSPSVNRLLQTLGLFDRILPIGRGMPPLKSQQPSGHRQRMVRAEGLEDQHTLAGRLRKNGMQVRAMLAHGGHKETATAFPNAAALADFEIEILPVGN